MRIVHWSLGRVNPESSNGVDKTVYALSRAQAALGHEVSVFSITPLQAIPIPGVDVRTFAPRMLPLRALASLTDRPVPRNPFRLPPGLMAELQAWAPDIVHFHSVHIPEALWTARRFQEMGIPYCVTPHGGLITAARSQRGRLRKKLFLRVLEGTYLNRARFLHAVSRAEAEMFPSYGIRNRTVFAPNCIDPSVVPTEADGSLLRRRFPHLGEARVLVYVGRLDPQAKGLDLLLRAWSHLRDHARMRLVLVGPDWRGQKARLEALATTLGVPDSIVFAGPAHGDEKWSLLTAGDAFVHPSRWEAGVPFAVLEAMAARRPLILTEACDPDGIIRRHQAGLVVPADTASLVGALRTVDRSSEATLAEMGQRAGQLIEDEFRWERTARILVDAYRDAMPDRR